MAPRGKKRPASGKLDQFAKEKKLARELREKKEAHAAALAEADVSAEVTCSQYCVWQGSQ